ncbi:MAG: tetratricopeptide repeat protein, partial [Candidatus Jacksonbacteria bacterium]
MLNITAFSIIIISLSIIIFIIYRKIPLLKHLDMEEFNKEKNKKISLLEQMLKRDFNKIKDKMRLKKLEGIKFKAFHFNNYIKKLYSTVKKYKKDLNVKSKTPEIKEDKLNQAQDLFRQGKLKEAEGALIEIIKGDPKSLDAYRLLAEVYFESKIFVHAEATLEHIVKLAERLKQLRACDYLELANNKLKLDKLGEALQNAQKALKLEPLNPKILHFMLKTCIMCKQK